MAVQLPNGSLIAVGSTYGTAKTMSAITNATDAVATLEASHGVIVSDIVRITSGWPRLNGRIARASAVATNDVTLEDMDTSSTTRYPVGAGIGSVQEITAWTTVSQILEFSSQGGDQQFVTYSFLEEDVEHQIPTVKTAQSFSLVIGDDATLAHYAVLSAADEDRAPRAIRITLANSSVIYAQCYITLNRTPTLTKNEVMGLRATFSLVADVTRYTS